jgi:uncharacterized protein YPO0396
MPSASQQAMTVATSPEFQARVRLALVKTALAAIDDQNSARAAFAQRVLTDRVNLFMAAVAVVANASIGSSIASAGDNPGDTFGVADDDIAFTIAENGNPATGVFAKLAAANVGG